MKNSCTLKNGSSYLVFCVVIASMIFVSGCGEKYISQKSVISEILYENLIDNGVCVDLKNCHENEYVFGEAGDKVRLNIYGVSDRNVCQKILAGVIMNENFTKNVVPVVITFYPFKKIDYLGWNGRKEIKVISMEVNF